MASICTGHCNRRMERRIDVSAACRVSFSFRYPVMQGFLLTDSTRVEPSGFGAIFLPINGGANNEV